MVFVALVKSKDVEASKGIEVILIRPLSASDGAIKGIEVVLIRPSSASDEVYRGIEVILIIVPSSVMMHVATSESN